MAEEYQFKDGRIQIQPYAATIGPFAFDLSGQVPPGDSIASILVSSMLGTYDTTANLITSSSLGANNIVSVYFKYPGATLEGMHKLTVRYTLTSGGKDEADFYGVEVGEV